MKRNMKVFVFKELRFRSQQGILMAVDVKSGGASGPKTTLTKLVIHLNDSQIQVLEKFQVSKFIGS